MIEVFEGSLLDVPDVTAIVVPANKQLTLDWGSHLAELIKKKAGAVVEQEALAQGERLYPDGCPLGGAVVTSGGALPFEHLIHAAVLDKYDMNPLFLLKLKHRTSVDTLRAATLTSLQRAKEAGIESVGFSPMGAGIGGMSTKLCAEIMLETVQEFLEKQGPFHKIVFAALKPKDAKIFRKFIEV